MISLNRKADTRRKIQLGGLIKKAGLDLEPMTVLYGLLLNSKENLEKNREQWHQKGKASFTEK